MTAPDDDMVAVTMKSIVAAAIFARRIACLQCGFLVNVRGVGLSSGYLSCDFSRGTMLVRMRFLQAEIPEIFFTHRKCPESVRREMWAGQQVCRCFTAMRATI